MPQNLLISQLKEKPTYRVWCLYSSYVHGHTYNVYMLAFQLVFYTEVTNNASDLTKTINKYYPQLLINASVSL
jgi:hypothetical protein